MGRLNFVINAFNEQTSANPSIGLIVNSSSGEGSANIPTAKGRVYVDGDVPGPFILLTGNSISVGHVFANLNPGIYVVEYQDINVTKILAKVTLRSIAGSCLYSTGSYHENSNTFSITSNDVGVTIRQGVNFSNPDSLVPNRQLQVFLDSYSKTIVDFYSGSAFWTISELTALGMQYEIGVVTLVRVITACEAIVAEELKLATIVYLPLSGFLTKTDVTTNGGSDGTVVSTISGGSGNYEYLWSNAETSPNLSGVTIGVYSVTVHDLITDEVIVLEIEVNQPDAPPSVPNEGLVLKVPYLNSIRFTVPDDLPQNIDNTPFCELYFEGFKTTNYYQPVEIADTPLVQINSDFDSHILELLIYGTDELVRSFSMIMREQNIGVTEDFNIIIRDHSEVGQSRVLFASGAPPIPLSIGDTITIMNNLDGFDGSYSIVDEVYDPLLGYSYLVINLNYAAPGLTSSATGRFLSNNADYNVYEAALSFAGLTEGIYYLKLTALAVNTKFAYSEPIDLKERHINCNEVVYRNVDDGYGDITWTTGYIGKVRFMSYIGHKPNPGGVRSISRESNYDIVKVNAKKTRGDIFDFQFVPVWAHQKLADIFDCDFFFINGVQYQTSEAYDVGDYIDGFLLSHSTIKVEMKGFNKKYNSDDIGTVNEDGLLETETGFIKL